MAPVVAEIALENKDTFAVAKLNTGNNPKTIQKYQEGRIHPTYIVFQDGKFVERFRGVTPKDELLQKIRSVIDVAEN